MASAKFTNIAKNVFFKLEEYKTEWANKPGFGTISVNKKSIISLKNS